MIFGISLGSKKQSGSGTSNIDKTTDLSGKQQSATTSQGTTNTTQTGTTNTSQTGKTSGLTTQDNTTQGSGTSQQTGTTTTLGADVQSALSDRVKALLGSGVSDAAMAQLNEAILGRNGFNVDQFVTQQVTAARNRGEQTLQEQNSAIASNVGGTAGTNSMAALLAQRGRNDLEASIAGIESNARATGEKISNENLSTSTAAAQGVNNMAAGLLDALKGATSTTDLTTLTSQIEQLIGKGSNIGSTTQTGAEQTSTNQQTNQLLTEIANILTQQSQHEVGTESQTTKGKTGGFGISLGI